MACTNRDGSLTRSALELLQVLEEPLAPEQIIERSTLPLFRLRASLRELAAAGLVKETEEGFIATAAGQAAARAGEVTITSSRAIDGS